MTTVSISSKVISGKQALNIPRVNWKMVYILGLAMCFMSFVFYIASINQLTKGAYLVKTYNQKISVLTKENKVMELNYAEKALLDKMHTKVNELGFEKISSIKYVEVSNGSLAKAQ